MKQKQQARPIFIYLAVIAVILAIVGVLIIEKDLSGRAIVEKNVEKKAEYSKEEILKHNSEKDCWVFLYNKVYDITLLLQIYPYDLRQECGKELKPGYFSSEEIKILDEYEIGVLRQ